MDPSLLPEGHGLVMQTENGEFVPVGGSSEDSGGESSSAPIRKSETEVHEVPVPEEEEQRSSAPEEKENEGK